MLLYNKNALETIHFEIVHRSLYYFSVEKTEFSMLLYNPTLAFLIFTHIFATLFHR